MASKKERNDYDLKEMEKKNAKIVSLAWHHNVLTEMFTVTEKSTLLYEKIKFLTNAWLLHIHTHLFRSRVKLYSSSLGFY